MIEFHVSWLEASRFGPVYLAEFCQKFLTIGIGVVSKFFRILSLVGSYAGFFNSVSFFLITKFQDFWDLKYWAETYHFKQEFLHF